MFNDYLQAYNVLLNSERSGFSIRYFPSDVDGSASLLLLVQLFMRSAIDLHSQPLLLRQQFPSQTAHRVKDSSKKLLSCDS